MIDERDQLIERAARALSPLPPANAQATARIVAAVRARRGLVLSPWTRAIEWMREPTLSLASASFLAAAALAVGFVTRGALNALDESTIESTTQEMPVQTAKAPVQPVADQRLDVRAIPVPIVFEAPGANAVAIVGDFNDWDSAASPMKRYGKNGPWTTTVSAKPGRHVYAFVVDGTLVPDPRAPRAHDLDYGGDASVLMVANP
jgi:AMP-activated protein kinase-like protein